MDPRISISGGKGLHAPVLVAAWPGMGLVGLKTVQYLRESFDACKIAEIDACDFFRLGGVRVEHGVISPPRLPRSEFFSFKPAGCERDIVLFIGEEQPAGGKELPFVDLVLDVVEYFEVERIFTAAAMVTSVQHNQPSRVWAAATSKALLDDLPQGSYVPMEDGNIGGLNGLLLGAAMLRGLEGCCLLGEIPYYVTNLENPKATAVVLELLSAVLGFEVDLESIRRKAAYVENQIDNAVKQVRADVGRALSGEGEGEDESGDDSHGMIN